MKRFWWLPSVMLLFICGNAASCFGNPGEEAFVSAETAGPDFAVQGEYAGEFANFKWGVQVIALGDGKFDAVTYKGGLPGEGWKRGDERIRAKGKTEGGVTLLESEDHKYKARIENGKLSVTDAKDQPLGTLNKVERTSHSLGAAPPPGAVVLFDGKSAEQFENGQLVDGQYLNVGVISKQEFTDFTLHLEFRTPFMPKSRGQARGNSGVYLQHRYEVQVLDSFGLEGENNECGGLYSLKSPAVNMCLPPLSWQTYDIDFTAARFEGDKKVKNGHVTIKHNFEQIYDNEEIPQLTPGGAKTESPGRGPLFLQDHTNPVVYRNIWILEKK